MSHQRTPEQRAALIRWRDVHNTWATVRAAKRHILDLLDLRDGLAVLDAGCGTGDDVLALAERVGPTGRAVGLDLDEDLLAEARARAARTSLPIRFDRGDVHALPYEDGAFDRCRSERVLHHLADPRQALRELVRVARPGGRVVVGDTDFGATLVGGPEPALTDAIGRFAIRTAREANWRLGRDLGYLFRACGLRELRVLLHLMGPVAGEFGPEVMARARRSADEATAAGAISARDAARWLAELEAADREGTAFMVAAFCIVAGTKP